MATRTKTTRFAFATRLTDVATNTTLGTATRFDFTSITLYIPEGTRTIKNAWARFSFFVSDATAAIDIDGVRLGIKVGGAAFVDVDTTFTAPNTGEAETIFHHIDFTSNLSTNIGAGASQTIQAGIAVATGSATNIRNITCEIFVTYEYDDAATTHVKTVVIPFQSDVTDLTTSFAESGSAGTAPAPANQIPQLTGAGSPFLPEASVTIRDQYIVVTSHSYASPATTDFNMDVRLDGSTTLARATYEAALQTSIRVHDILDSSLMPSTTAAHALEFKSSLADRFWATGGYMVVTYEFAPGSSSTILNSVCVPLDNPRSSIIGVTDNSTNQQFYTLTVNIQEPTTITMVQTGVVISAHTQGNSTKSIAATGQTTRPYVGVSGQAQDSSCVIIHRTDHTSSNWSLARGINKLSLTWGLSSNATQPSSMYALLNYTSGKAAGGVGTHNHTLWYLQKAYEGTATQLANTTPTPPVIPESVYQISGIIAEMAMRSNTGEMEIGADRDTGEDSGDGQYICSSPANNLSTEIGTKWVFFPITWFRDASYKTGAYGANIETSRAWRFSGHAVSASYASCLALTYHSCQFTVAGDVTNNGNNIDDTVEIFAQNADGSCDRVATTTSSSGAFSVEVSDNTRDHFASYSNGTTIHGRSNNGTPETDTFDITMFSGASGSGNSPRSHLYNGGISA